MAKVGDCHRDERARDPLAYGDEHVELARLGPRRDLVGERDELVRVLAHGGDDPDDACACLLGGDQALGDAADLLGVGDGGAAELHHERAEAGLGRGRLDGGDRFIGRLGH